MKCTRPSWVSRIRVEPGKTSLKAKRLYAEGGFAGQLAMRFDAAAHRPCAHGHALVDGHSLILHRFLHQNPFMLRAGDHGQFQLWVSTG